MDLWVVGAAAAAGYIAKQLKLSRDSDSSLEPSSGASEFEKPGTYSCPLRRLTQRKKQAKDSNADGAKSSYGRLSDQWVLDCSEAEAVSTNDCGEKLESVGYEDCISGSGLSSVFSLNDSLQQKGHGDRLNDDMNDSCLAEMDARHLSVRNRSSLRTKRLNEHLLKPLTSLESCLIAQLYNEHTRMEEYVLSILPSPSSSVRPLIITDGRRIIGRAASDSFSAEIAVDSNRHRKEAGIFGVPPLPRLGPLDLPKKKKSKAGKSKERFGSSSKTSNGKHPNLQNGSHDVTSLLCIGICIGVISSLVTNRREVDKLKDTLKQTENLVQDLQEELEMKDSLTVKELVNENNGSQDTCENSCNRAPSADLSIQKVADSTTNAADQASYNEKAEESSESMSKIEAELEAELERLGLNVSTSNLERTFPDLVELDPDYEPDFAQGELRAETVRNRSNTQPESNRDASSTSTTHSANYAVSPRELSLRLHEVIQSRLEERVKELETALQNRQKKVQCMGSEQKSARRKLSSSELRYSSGESSPMMRDQPLVINLLGEALDAYNEAYEELTKPNDSESDGSPYDIYENVHRTGLLSTGQTVSWGQNEADGSLVHLCCTNQLDGLLHREPKISELLYDGGSEDEKSDGNGEMEQQLIRQIVEKTRKGSPVVLNAQRFLFSMDGKEH